ncbi:hypothetical protein [Nitrobacter winogradskyi]|uniref:hypothetical protein n=1 Tax=Nitrobacter winogradskyi TaxID=913 RepID=UPI00059B5C3A|nr:hypothetical protein [Nitrobacter winogradskyi]
MHHAKEAHKFARPPSHAFALPRDGEIAELLQQAFPEAYFDEKNIEWRIDWDERQFPTQGRALTSFQPGTTLKSSIAIDVH